MSIEQGVLAPLSPTSVSQMASSVAEDQLKGVIDLNGDYGDEDQNCLCSDDFNEIDVVTHANLFDYEHFQAHLCVEASEEKERYSHCHGTFVGIDDIEPILGLEKRKRVSRPQGCIIKGNNADVRKSTEERSVSFAPSCKVIQLESNQTEGLEHELWYSRYDFMLFEDEACLRSQMIQQSETRGTFDGELGQILGLEKIILCDSYFDRREALMEAVMDEQAVQHMAKEVRFRQGYGCGQESDDIGLMQLANTSERYSLWARERASMIALTLEHDLANKTHEYAIDEDKRRRQQEVLLQH